jgi:hypothetical protein
MLDYSLLVVPVVLAVRSNRDARVAGEEVPGIRDLQLKLLAYSVVAFVFWLAIWHPVTGVSSDPLRLIADVLPSLVFGILLGLSARSSWVLVAMPLLLSLRWFDPAYVDLSLSWSRAGVSIVFALVAGCWLPLLSILRRVEGNGVTLVILLNALNALDSLSTVALTRASDVVEANPIVRMIGLPIKLAVVALASVILYRVRPSALLWPVIAFSCVLLWHVSGVLGS